jgi:putative tryptophan/tyrosine transport system substrate-binding protein
MLIGDRVKRGFPLLVAALNLAAADTAWAQQTDRIPVVGVLSAATATSNPVLAGLRESLRELGYVEGRNIKLEVRGAEGRMDRLPRLAQELGQLNVDVIVAFNTPAARAALEATTLPVVFQVGDPVGSQLAESLVRPGGSGTGISMVSVELTSKQLEFLHLMAPRARRIACLSNSANPVGARVFEEAAKAARTLNIQMVKLDARNTGELDAILHALPGSGVDGILVAGDPFLFANRAKLAQAVREARLPAIFTYREFHDNGVLMSYGAGLKDAARKLGVYVDKILKGAKAGDLPIEQISKYPLVIDLRVAHELRLKAPPELLQRADEVIR